MIKIIVHFAVSESVSHPFSVITDSRLRNFMKMMHQRSVTPEECMPLDVAE